MSEHAHPTVKTFVFVWVSLMVLTGVSTPAELLNTTVARPTFLAPDLGALTGPAEQTRVGPQPDWEITVDDGRLRARVLPDVKESTGRMDHALELSAPDFNPVVLLIDAETSHINKLTFVSDAPGRPIVEEEFSDYRAVEGVQFAFVGARRSGSQSIERRVTDLKLNAPLEPALFKRPS